MLTEDTLLTVKECAELTNLSIPTFYTPKRKKDLGFYEKQGDTWLIPVRLLIDNGLLTPDFHPTRSPVKYWRSDFEASSEQSADVAALMQKVALLETELSKMSVRLEEKDNQLDMLRRIVEGFGKSHK